MTIVIRSKGYLVAMWQEGWPVELAAHTDKDSQELQWSLPTGDSSRIDSDRLGEYDLEA
jgi:hypothetical protein